MKRKKRIAILADFPVWMIDSSIPSPNNHFAVWLVSMFESLPELADEFEFHWITISKHVSKYRQLEKKRQFFHILPGYSLKLAQLTWYARERFIISRLIKRLQVDLVHAWGTEKFYAIAAKNFKGKKLLSMQGILTAYCERASMPKFQITQSRFERTTMRAYQHISTESMWGVEQCKKLAPASAIHVWDYAANEQFFLVNRTLSNEPTCLMAGTDSPIKNVDSAIAAFSKPELSHVKLLLAGVSRENRPELPDNIIPLGRVSREEVAKLLSTTWCLVHPSLADTCPNIVKEARVVGVPCVVTEECGAKQYIINERSGFIIKPHDTEALTKSVALITASAENAQIMGAYDQERCRNELSKQTMMRKLIELYKSILEE